VTNLFGSAEKVGPETDEAWLALLAAQHGRDYIRYLASTDRRDYETPSEPELQAAIFVARNVGNDPERIKRILRKSARVRPKWDEPSPLGGSYLDQLVRVGLLQVQARTAAAAEAPQARCRTLAQLLEDPHALEPPAAVVPRLAWSGRLNMLAGREKLSGKSTLLTAAAASVTQASATFLGEVVSPGAVLWLSADQEHASDIAARAVRFGANPPKLHVLWPGPKPFEELEEAVRVLTPAWVIIDSLANFAQSRVEKASTSDDWPDVMLPLLALARSGPAVTIVHHATKATGEFRDSTAIAANVDMCLGLKPVPDHATWRKVESIGRWIVDDFTIELEGNVYRLVLGAEVAASTERGRDRLALLNALGDGEHTAKQVADALGWTKRKVEERLKSDPDVTRRMEGLTYLYRRTEVGTPHARTTSSARARVVGSTDTTQVHACAPVRSCGQQDDDLLPF
jgi:hypothetical protein